MEIIDLKEKDILDIENRLEEYDNNHIKYSLDGRISLGIKENGKIIAGVDSCMTAFKILYVSTLYVDELYRRKGFGKILIQELEKKAKKLGANTIRLDTFSFQGKDFYLAMGYKIVGEYENKEDGYSEYFFMKRI